MQKNLEKARKFVKENTPNYKTTYRLNYHLMAQIGWLNDPNGLTYFNGEYHAFYQHHPYDKDWGPMHWGHAKSKDMVQWEHLPIALAPGEDFDKGGCYSGSAVDNNGELTLIYTGHIFDDPNNRDPFSTEFHQNQNIAVSKDGVNFEKYSLNPVISGPPEDNTQNFRDPKVWFENNEWNMVVGSTSKQNIGRAILYRSKDLINWTYIGVLADSDGSLGTMWECPDFFKLDDKDVLLFSPVGMQPLKEKYNNVFQTGYIIGNYDYQNNNFVHGDFEELDRGHDFYAIQTFQTADGRRVGMGWMNMWQTVMPEKEDNWAGGFTLPRELKVVGNRIKMTPIKELENIREGKILQRKLNSINETIQFDDNSVEMLLNIPLLNGVVGFKLLDSDGVVLEFTYDSQQSRFKLLRRGEDGERSCITNVDGNIDLQVYLDKSSIEIFINDGLEVFTSRIYPKTACSFELIYPTNECDINATFYKLKKVID